MFMLNVRSQISYVDECCVYFHKDVIDINFWSEHDFLKARDYSC